MDEPRTAALDAARSAFLSGDERDAFVRGWEAAEAARTEVAEPGDVERVANGIAAALARVSPPIQPGEAIPSVAARLAPLVIESGWFVPARAEVAEPGDVDIERLADWFMDLRLDGPAAEGWTYQQTARHYAALLLTGSETRPPEKRERLAWVRAATAGREPLDALREAAQAFLDWYDQPGRSYVRDGSGPAAIEALRAALDTPDPGASS